MNKTKIYFSHNVARHERTMIDRFLDFSKTNNLGKYLGIHLLYSRVNKDMYQYILKNI
uniref:Uncharacterized protein n=1 Tax=Manihot esculenta TaxID=3983 RepID=A0A2C9WJM0_MANES